MRKYATPFTATMFSVLAWLNVLLGAAILAAVLSGAVERGFGEHGGTALLAGWGAFAFFYLVALPLFAVAAVLGRLTDIANEVNGVAVLLRPAPPPALPQQRRGPDWMSPDGRSEPVVGRLRED